MELTKEQALIACADHWNLVGHLKIDSGLDVWDLKSDARYTLWPGKEIFADCWCCQYVRSTLHLYTDEEGCKKCPVWGGPKTKMHACVHSRKSPFKAIHEGDGTHKNAFAIRDLALKALEKLWGEK